MNIETAQIQKDLVVTTQKSQFYDVVVIGGGVTGTALLYVLANYSNVAKIALIEKCTNLGQVNSHHHNNSQTLHFGDIETNYDLEKALRVKAAAELLAGFLENIARDKTIFRKANKMVVATTAEQRQLLIERYQQFGPHYHAIRLLNEEEIFAIEPQVMWRRDIPDPPVCALATTDGYIVDYGKLAEEFVNLAIDINKTITLLLGFAVKQINRTENGFEIITNDNQKIHAKTLAINAGPYSLIFAKMLGYGQDLEILPVSGNFYFVNRGLLKGKVYTVQIEGLPFAAIHGDPEVDNPDITRFGPTARVLPLMERNDPRTFWDFLKTPVYNLAGLLSLIKVGADWKIIKFMLGNFLYEIPLLGKYLFLRKARKIVPTLRYQDLKFGQGYGGIRPQVIDTKIKQLVMAQAQIVGDGAIFNITPSPGASVCLATACEEAEMLIKALGTDFIFDRDRFLGDHRRDQIKS